jgi:hypothetical protein
MEGHTPSLPAAIPRSLRRLQREFTLDVIDALPGGELHDQLVAAHNAYDHEPRLESASALGEIFDAAMRKHPDLWARVASRANRRLEIERAIRLAATDGDHARALQLDHARRELLPESLRPAANARFMRNALAALSRVLRGPTRCDVPSRSAAFRGPTPRRGTRRATVAVRRASTASSRRSPSSGSSDEPPGLDVGPGSRAVGGAERHLADTHSLHVEGGAR